MKIIHPDLPSTKEVSANRTSKGSSVKGTASADKKAQAPSASGDKVSISPVSQHMETFEASLKAIPDVRMEKVESMQAKLASGYNPPAEEIADAIIRTVNLF